MDQQEALRHIRKAKAAHIKWRSYAQALVSGVPVAEDKIPVNHTDCAFGRWYSGEGKQLLGHLDSYSGVDTPHEMLHAIYHQIYDALHGEEDRSFVNKLFTSKAEIQRQKYDLARKYMVELIGVSETLLKVMDILEDEIRDRLD